MLYVIGPVKAADQLRVAPSEAAVALASPPNNGAACGRTMTIWLQLLELLQLPVAVHTTKLVPTGNSAGLLLVTVTLLLPLEEMIGLPRNTLATVQRPAGQLVLTVAGHVISGGWPPVTVTDCAQLLVLPRASVTVQCTIVVPAGNCVGASLMTVVAPQLSEVAGVPSATPVA